MTSNYPIDHNDDIRLIVRTSPWVNIMYQYWNECFKHEKLFVITPTSNSVIITLVRHKKARFDSMMHGSTQKSLVWRKNARFNTKMPSQACITSHCHYHPSPTPLWDLFFKYLFKNPCRCENEIILIWTQIYLISWNLKCNYHFFCLWWP